MERVALSRQDYPYSSERVTPTEEIPAGFRKRTPLPDGNSQVLDTRLCYNFNGKEFVECSSVWSHAEGEGFIPPEDR